MKMFEDNAETVNNKTATKKSTFTTTNLNMQISEQENNKDNDSEHQQHDSNLVKTTKHKEFQVVIVNDDLLKEKEKEKQQQPPVIREEEDEEEEDIKENISNNEEAVEPVPVEEGYATRKMDEYFRQTIAAIRQELTTKKTDTNDDYDDATLNNNNHDAVIVNYDAANTITNALININNNNINTASPISSRDNENFSGDSHNFKASINCIDCYLNGHCVVHQNNGNSSTHSPHNANGNNKKNSNIRFRNLINWFLIIGSVLNHTLVDGFIFNYSNLFLHVEKSWTNDDDILPNLENGSSSDLKENNTFQATGQFTYVKFLFTLPGAFLIAIYLFCIPISLYFSKRFGIRKISLIGSLLSALSIFAASFLKFDLGFFVLFYSILNGMYCFFFFLNYY